MYSWYRVINTLSRNTIIIIKGKGRERGKGEGIFQGKGGDDRA
jgi:hypothetical protein